MMSMIPKPPNNTIFYFQLWLFCHIYYTTNSDYFKIREWVCSVVLLLKLHEKDDMNNTNNTDTEIIWYLHLSDNQK